MHAADRLVASMNATGSVACVGLDPRPELIPPTVAADSRRISEDPCDQVCAAFLRFNLEILDTVVGACAAVKPQAACYEAYGWRGWRVLEATVAHARGLGIPVILDAKRGDIGSTAVHYRQGLLTAAPGLDAEVSVTVSGVGADWLTVNPYLGSDAVEPMLGSPEEGKGAFVLVRTSNPGAADLQDRWVGRERVYEVVARHVATWGADRVGDEGFSDVGAVVGATWPEEARALRRMLPTALFLVPGFGAQGGSADAAVAGATTDGGGVLVSSSRAIIGAWQGTGDDHGFAGAARVALDRMNVELGEALARR